MKAFTAATITAAALFAAVGTTAGAHVRSGFDAIGHHEAPQVIATDDLAYSLNDMDANLANILMVGSNSLGPGIDRDAFTKLYEQARRDADHELQLAAVNAGSSGPAADEVHDALDALGDYEALAAQVMYLDAAHPGRAAGQVPGDESALYAKATDMMQGRVLPTAGAVAASNGDALEDSYRQRHSQAEAATGWIAVFGAGAIAVLGAFQVFLRRRTNRLINPALAAATAVTVILTIWAACSMGADAEHLRSAKKDSFDSVSALSAAKALSTAANADESRIIVDPSRAAQYRESYLAKTQKLVDLGPDAILDTYDSRLKAALDSYFGDPTRHPVDFGGYFGTELKNITFPGERAAAEELLRAYQTYELDDRILRQKIATDLPEGIRFDTSPAPGDSNGAFNAYSTALQAVTDINTSTFDDSIAAGWNGLEPWPWVLFVGGLVVAVLVLVGIRPRLAEYR